MPRITLLGTLEVSLPRLGTIRATSCVTNALSTCTRGETPPKKALSALASKGSSLGGFVFCAGSG